MADRVILIGLLLVGFVIGICAGAETAGLGRSIYLVREAAADAGAAPLAARLEEARQGLEACFRLTNAAMYLGVVVMFLAMLGIYFQERRPQRRGQPE